MKKIVFNKYLKLFSLIFLFFFTYVFSQNIFYKKNLKRTLIDVKISIIKIVTSAGIFDITKFTSESSPSFFNKEFSELIKTNTIFVSKNKKKTKKNFSKY